MHRSVVVLFVATMGCRAESRPVAHVEHEVKTQFARAERQTVIVSIRDPLRPEPRPGPALARRDFDLVHRGRRRRDLAARKNNLLGELRRADDAVALVHEYPPFAVFAVEVTKANVAFLARHPDVTRISFDHEEEPHMVSSGPFIGLPELHQAQTRGAGTSVAILDTPVRWNNGFFGTCPAPGAPGCSVGVAMSFSGETPEQVMATEDLYNRRSHGTNVSAIALGVAPDTNILGLNVFYSNDQRMRVLARVSAQLAALAWVADNAEQYDIVAANMSLGGDRFLPTPCNDISRFEPIRTLLVEYGVLTVVSSGNDREQNALSRPACVSPAVAVAAQFDSDNAPYDGSCEQNDAWAGEVSCFSNLNGQIDIVAPGVRIDAGGYVYNGTSMAAPHVAGAVAAIQSRIEAEQGGFATGYWAHKRLLAEATAPNNHRDGRRFLELDFRDSIEYTSAAAFDTNYRETTAATIGTSTAAYTSTTTLDGPAFAVGGAYLYLEIDHPAPERVTVTLTAPGGARASATLVGGQANFTGIVGRSITPGVFQTMSGSSTGTWSLELVDAGGAGRGHVLQAAVFVTATSCTPDCVADGCGDDRCGGQCGAICTIEGACYLDRGPNPIRFCEVCDVATSTGTWSASADACRIRGTCYLAGSKQAGAPCSQCRPELAVEAWSTATDRCFVDGVCHSEGDRTAPDVCRSCQPAISTTALSGALSGSCDDGDSCTSDDTCRMGVCVGERITCMAIGQCYQTGECQPETGMCSEPFKPTGASCDDGDPCTIRDGCDEGVCAGTPKGCAAPNACQGNGRCELGDCVYDALADGTPCADGVCTSGRCESKPAPEREDDGCGCTTNRQSTTSAWSWLALLVTLSRRRVDRIRDSDR